MGFLTDRAWSPAFGKLVQMRTQGVDGHGPFDSWGDLNAFLKQRKTKPVASQVPAQTMPSSQIMGGGLGGNHLGNLMRLLGGRQ